MSVGKFEVVHHPVPVLEEMVVHKSRKVMLCGFVVQTNDGGVRVVEF